jgi:hypothetical protein
MRAATTDQLGRERDSAFDDDWQPRAASGARRGSLWPGTFIYVIMAAHPAVPASVRAARVLQIPTPRWTAYEAQRFDIDLPDEVPMTTQERAYTSPIWYTPG